MPTDPRCIIVTGASSGIGYELALQAAARGYAVLAVARRAERLDALRTIIERAGGRCVTLTMDVCAVDAPARVVATALQHFGRIDILVNNAGTGAAGTLLSQGDAAIDA
ncbi:MAG: SDR family NAD(P)-dependent oxidoreductase, partial [Vulcanimicrobiaceae bacterium]